MDSIGGFFAGLILFFVPFGLTYCAATTIKTSADIAKLQPVEASHAGGINGMALVEGFVIRGSEIEPPRPDNLVGPILHFEHQIRRQVTRIEEQERKETRIENGQEIEYTILEEVERKDWITEQESAQWAVLEFGELTIDPRRCTRLDLPRVETFRQTTSDPATGEPLEETQSVIYSGIKCVLTASLASGEVATDTPFCILAFGSRDELLAKMDREEEAGRWFKLVVAVVLMTVSFNLMLGPALLIINIFPIRQLSCAIRAVITLVSLVVSTVLLLVTYVIVRYWWVIVILLLGLAIWVVLEANKNRTARPDLEPGGDLDPHANS